MHPGDCQSYVAHVVQVADSVRFRSTMHGPAGPDAIFFIGNTIYYNFFGRESESSNKMQFSSKTIKSL